MPCSMSSSSVTNGPHPQTVSPGNGFLQYLLQKGGTLGKPCSGKQ